MITAPDDGLVRCHEDARQLLASAVPGARLTIARPAAHHGRDSTRTYQITVARHGAPDVCVLGAYTLPTNADRLAAHAREQVDAKMR